MPLKTSFPFAASCFAFLLRGLSSWWLLAPNTPRQDHGPCTHRRNLKFRLPVFFRHLPGKGQTEWFALCTPCSFFPDAAVSRRLRDVRRRSRFVFPPRRGYAEKDEGVQGENLRLAPWSTGVETFTGAKIEFLRRVQGPWSCRGVLGARSPQLQTGGMKFAPMTIKADRADRHDIAGIRRRAGYSDGRAV